MAGNDPSRVTLLDQWRLNLAITLEPELTPSAKVVGALLLEHYNIATGQCYPSFDKLAEESQLDRSTVIRGINELVDRGWFRCSRGGGRGKSNHYEPAFERVAASSLFLAKTVAVSSEKGGDLAPKTVASTPPETKKETEKETSVARVASPPYGGSARDGHNDHKRAIADVLAEHEIPQGSVLTGTIGTRTVTYAVPGGERRTFDLPSGIGPRMMPDRL